MVSIKMAGHQGFIAGTECVGKFNFLGSAAHVSYMYFILPNIPYSGKFLWGPIFAV